MLGEGLERSMLGIEDGNKSAAEYVDVDHPLNGLLKGAEAIPNESWGIIPRAAADLFASLATEPPSPAPPLSGKPQPPSGPSVSMDASARLSEAGADLPTTPNVATAPLPGVVGSSAIPAGIAARGRRAIVTCSYLQIYQDKVFDLLTDGKQPPQPLALREHLGGENGDSGGGVSGGSGCEDHPLNTSRGHGHRGSRRGRRKESGVYVAGLSVCRVESVGDVLAVLRKGAANRAVRATE
jgi:hypothetical protein